MTAKLITSVLLFGTLCASLNAQGWEPPVQVGGGWHGQQMAFDSTGQAYLVYSSGIAISQDGARTWGTPLLLAAGMWSQNPTIAIDSHDRVFIAFQGDPTYLPGAPVSHRCPYLVTSFDRGQTWSQPVKIAEVTYNSSWSRLLVDSNDVVHLIWNDLNWNQGGPNNGPAAFYHMKSTDHGATWTQNTIVNANHGFAMDAAIDSHDRIYAVWDMNPLDGFGGVFLFKSTDGGATWTGSLLASGGLNGGIAIDTTDALHVVYAASTGPHVAAATYKRSQDGGVTWDNVQILGTSRGPNCCGPETWPTIAVDPRDNSVMAAWQDRIADNTEVYYRWSPNRGQTWMPIQQLTNTPLYSLNPELFVDRDSVVHLVWDEADNVPTFHSDVYTMRGRNTQSATLWLGASDRGTDQTPVDVRAELYVNGALMTAAELRCVTGLKYDPELARETTLSFGPYTGATPPSGSTETLKILARIGTNSDGTMCGGRSNATALRLYHDGADRPTRFGMVSLTGSVQDLFLHGSGRSLWFDPTAPAASSARYEDAKGLHFAGGNPWKEVGSWTRIAP